MKINRFTLIISCIFCCIFLFQYGCEEQAASQRGVSPEWFNQPVWQQIRSSSSDAQVPPPAPGLQEARNSGIPKQVPKITFAAMSHDFGRIAPGSTNNICEFAFTNTGNTNLLISDLRNSCSCTLSLLENDKREYAPGESGKILAGYTDTELGQAIKHIYVFTNDPINPRVELAIKAEVVAPIDFEPKKINLSLISNNGDCPQIIVRSLDNQPFAITGFQSTNDCITVNYNPQVNATRFVLQPQVDMVKLRRNPPDGGFKINLSRPDCEVVSGTFYTPPRFSANPHNITISQADPQKSVIKTINIVSNYEENFTIRPSLSDKGIISIIDTQKTRSGYQLTVQINPPVPDNKTKMFSDSITIVLEGVGNIVIPCNGYYPGATVPLGEDDGECKTCGPKRIDNPTFNPGYKQ
jgi:hypothetical protein